MQKNTDEKKARYIMIGGFLGAGKTTAVAALARRLVDRRVRVGLITNDQSTGLVDTNLLRSQGFSVEEIAGGCFCCRFNSLLEASTKLTVKTRPDVFLAEPVGSCTDLVATVSYPLHRIYGDRFIISPLSILVDPNRAARILDIQRGRPFSEKVVYIYKKQLEEADLIVVNKCDSISSSLRDNLVTKLAELFPRADILSCSAREGTDLAPWFERILTEECDPFKATMDLDYETYAEGEAQLGWLNCTVGISSGETFDANLWLLGLARSLRDRIHEEGGKIAHLKMTFDAGDPSGNLSIVSVVRSDEEPDLRESLVDELTEGDLIINLRAEADPDRLRGIVTETFQEIEQSKNNYRINVEHMECFRPRKPQPTHRFSGVEGFAEKTAATKV
jgi:G3E family GTPase